MMFARSIFASFAVLTTTLVSFSAVSVGADTVDVSTSFLRQKKSIDDEQAKAKAPVADHDVLDPPEGYWEEDEEDGEGDEGLLTEEERAFLAELKQYNENFPGDMDNDPSYDPPLPPNSSHGDMNMNGTISADDPVLQNDSGRIIFKSTRNTNYCMDVRGGTFQNYQQVWLWECNDSWAQKWWVSSSGRIQIGRNWEYCLSGGSGGLWDSMYIYRCSSSSHHRWNIGRNNWHMWNHRYSNRCVGVTCGNFRAGSTVELQHDISTSNCRSRQQWFHQRW